MPNIVFYSNCQAHGIKYFLVKALSHRHQHYDGEEKRSEHFNFHHIENYSLIKNQGDIPVDILATADVFIYQPIDRKHGKYSTNQNIEQNIMTHLPVTCIRISFPYIYHSSLWILIPPAYADAMIGDYGSGEYINSAPIKKLKISGNSLETVLDMYSRGQIDFEYNERFNQSIAVLREKEKHCDVKVAQFIEENIRKQKLFLTQNHPTSCIFIHCVNQILHILGIDFEFCSPCDFPANVADLPGEHLHTSYDQKYWKFQYEVCCNYDTTYIDHIRTIYANTILN